MTEHPGLYGVGLPWLTRHISATWWAWVRTPTT
ncbi:hypothetical protein QF050_003747 [Arthrobacter sp. SLBN-112]|nr:hypothetical protein [Arthrobacter sp. SLBN-112]